MKKVYLCTCSIMFLLYLFCKNGQIADLLFYKNGNEILWVQSVTTQFIHYTLLHYLCNMLVGWVVLKELVNRFSFWTIIITGIGSIVVIAILLEAFAKTKTIYCGFSGTILSWYSILMMDKMIKEKDGYKKKEIIIDTIMLVLISIISPGVSILMHLAGILTGVCTFGLIKYCQYRIKK